MKVNNWKNILIATTLLLYMNNAGMSQTSPKGEFWGAYITNTKLTERFSVWNDVHYTTNAFFLTRHGLTFWLKDNIDFTAGYAYVRASTHFTNRLSRSEYRLWGQIIGRFDISKRWNYQLRLRHDGRFRDEIIGEEILNDKIFYHRARVMNDLRFTIKEYNKGKLHLDLIDEILFNFDDQIQNGLDQNRLYLLLGYSTKKLTLLGGAHSRMVPTGGEMKYFYGATLWLTHTIDLQRKNK